MAAGFAIGPPPGWPIGRTTMSTWSPGCSVMGSPPAHGPCCTPCAGPSSVKPVTMTADDCGSCAPSGPSQTPCTVHCPSSSGPLVMGERLVRPMDASAPPVGSNEPLLVVPALQRPVTKVSVNAWHEPSVGDGMGGGGGCGAAMTLPFALRPEIG